MGKHSLLVYSGVIGLAIALSGCGIFQGEQTLEEMDSPQEEASYTDLDAGEETGTTEESETAGEENGETPGSEETGTETEEGLETATVERQLYLLDAKGMVVPQTFGLPKAESKEVAKQVLEYLVKGGPVTEMLPNGFEAVLPQGTSVLGLNLKDGTLTVDFSKEFAEYRPEDEQKILQAVTYTLTQFDNVERIKLWINGYEKTEMPVNGTPLSGGYSRADGINIYEGDSIDLLDSEAVTLYYPAQYNEQLYHVPVTQHVEIENGNEYQSIVQALLEGPVLGLGLQSISNPGAALINEPKYQEGILTLNFNENVLSSVEGAAISDELMASLVLTLTDQPGVKAVDVKVENVKQVFNENGAAYTEPVTRQTIVPAGSL